MLPEGMIRTSSAGGKVTGELAPVFAQMQWLVT